jgi:acetate kinase
LFVDETMPELGSPPEPPPPPAPRLPFRVPADYYATPERAPVLPRFVPFGCGTAAIVFIVALLAFVALIVLVVVLAVGAVRRRRFALTSGALGCGLALLLAGAAERALEAALHADALQGPGQGSALLPFAAAVGGMAVPALLYLLATRHERRETLDHALNFESGMKGLAGGSGTMLELQERAATGDGDAVLALDVFTHRVAGAVAAMAASAGGLDALVFTAGIGEGSALVRRRVCGRLAYHGVDLDEAANAGPTLDCDIAADGSRVRVLVIGAREEIVAARAARALLGRGP